jgi:hypothetical protein
MARGFKRSKWFGLIGVFVVAGMATVIATTVGQGDPNPKLALGLIFGEVIVAAPGPKWSPRSRDGRVRPDEGAPDAVLATLQGVPNSVGWKRVEVLGGPDEIVVTRKKGGQGDWLCDLWLAERLAAS